MGGEWTVRPLEECMAALIDYRGKTPQKTSYGIPLITAKVVKGGRIETPDEFIAVDDYEPWMRRGIPEAGDIVITTEAPLGEVAQLGSERVALAQRLIALRGKPGVLDNRFLKFLLQSSDVQDQLRARASGTTVLGIKQSELRKILLTLPTIEEQRTIAHILGTLDDKIELNRQMNETLEAMARALFKSWFVDFDPVLYKSRAECRGTLQRAPTKTEVHLADLFPDSFEDSELGEIPKGWSAAPLYSIATYINGAAYAAFQPNDERRGLPIIKIAELKAGVTAQTKFSDVQMPEKYRVAKGDILFSWSGNPDTSIDTFVWSYGSAWLNQHIFRVSPHHQHESTFVLSTLKTLRPVFAEIARNKQTTGLGHVTVEDMKSLLIARPDDRVMRAWNAVAGPLYARAFQNLREIHYLSALRDTLLPKLISGEVRVGDAERFLGRHV